MIDGDDDRQFDPLINDLLEKVPEYRSVYDHEIDYYGDISAWTFFGSILVKFTLKAFRAYREDAQNIAAQELVNRIFDFIEHYASSTDEDILELIHTGFVEALYLA